MKLTFIVLYLSVALVAVTSALINPLQTNCKRIDLRRNIADFTEDQLDGFFNAVQTLKDTPDPILPDTSIFDKYVKIHLDFAPKAHGSAHFLPWHRLFIREFELELQRVDPSVVLPFWNWAISSQSPERSIVFGKNYFGGTGDPSTGCVTTGRFANWQIRFPQKECLKRKFNGGTIIGAFTAPEILLRLIKESPSFENFASNLEAGAHARVHNGVGGTFAKMESNSDPLFYLHHANVDRLWSMYQNRGAKQAMEFNGKRPGDGGSATLNDVLMPFKKTVRQAMDMVTGLCYTYTQRRIPKPVKTVPIASRPVVTSSQIVPRSYSMPTPDEITPDISFKQEHTIATPNAMRHKEAAAGETRSNSARYVESRPHTNQKPNPPHVGKTSWEYTPYLLDPFDRSNLKRIRMPFTVPESWLKMNNISVDDYATKEAALIQEVKAYNARPQASVASLQFYKGNTSCDVISDKVYKAYGVPIPSKQSVQLTAPIGNVNFLSAEGITDLHLDPENLPAVDENGIRSHAPSSAPSISLAGVLATVLLSVNMNCLFFISP